MKRIIAAIDGLKFSDSTVKYAVHIAQQVNAKVVGVFLEDTSYHSYKMYELIAHEDLLPERRAGYDRKDQKQREEAILNFKDICAGERVECSIHHDRNIPLTELLHESIYADLLIIDSSQSLTYCEEATPTRFIKDLLSEAQCPVLVVPKEFNPIHKLTLLYDGEPSSVFAIRMFSYVLSTFKNQPTEVISVSHSGKADHHIDNRLMKEFMKQHYPKAEYTVLIGDPETEIIDQLREQGRNMVIILGAYRRGTVSRWLKASMADTLMEELKVPLFIAHCK
jgi:nucleotide-binding universal stress UspA family protein